MGKYFFVLAFLASSIIGSGQNKNSGYHFQSINSIELVNGNNAASGALQSVNGIKKGLWFAGVGVGIDYYLYRSVPAFADLRYEFGNGKNKFFAYTDAGININWIKENNTGAVIYYDYLVAPSFKNYSNNYYNGVYTDAGLGYAVAAKKNNALIISLGYSRKSFKETSSYPDWRSTWQTDIYRYRMNRVILKIGWRF